MDAFLELLYQQYTQLQIDKRQIEMNLTKIGELILLNKGTPPAAPSLLIAYDIEKNVPQKSEYKGKEQRPYKNHMNWNDKIMYVLQSLETPATAKQIALKIRELEPATTQSVEKSVELTTSRMSKAGLIAAKKEGVKNYYYLVRD